MSTLLVGSNIICTLSCASLQSVNSSVRGTSSSQVSSVAARSIVLHIGSTRVLCLWQASSLRPSILCHKPGTSKNVWPKHSRTFTSTCRKVRKITSQGSEGELTLPRSHTCRSCPRARACMFPSSLRFKETRAV